MTQPLELGLDTFGDVTVDSDGNLLPYDQVIRNVIDEAVLADSLGVDSFGLGEQHRADFAVSSPETVLAKPFTPNALLDRVERLLQLRVPAAQVTGA